MRIGGTKLKEQWMFIWVSGFNKNSINLWHICIDLQASSQTKKTVVLCHSPFQFCPFSPDDFWGCKKGDLRWKRGIAPSCERPTTMAAESGGKWKGERGMKRMCRGGKSIFGVRSTLFNRPHHSPTHKKLLSCGCIFFLFPILSNVSLQLRLSKYAQDCTFSFVPGQGLN